MKAKFDKNGNLAISAESAEEKVALKLWIENQVSSGSISEDIFTKEPPTLVVLLNSYDVSGAV